MKSIYRYILEKKLMIKCEVAKKLIGNIHVLSEIETLKLVDSKNMSVSRFGDGEFDLINGKDLKFQKWSKPLEEKLHHVLKSKEKHHLICIPNIFSDLSKLTSNSANFARETVLFSYKLLKTSVDNQYSYGSTFVTRFYIGFKPESRDLNYPEKLKKIWKDSDLLIVEGMQSRLGVGNDLFNNTNSIKRILCPATDAFAHYDEIISSIVKNNISNLVLLALGPTATILAYDLAKLGIRALDIGHVDIEYEWFIRKANKKIDIKGKHVNEVSGLILKDDFRNKKYESEIIYKIDELSIKNLHA